MMRCKRGEVLLSIRDGRYWPRGESKS